MELRVLVTGSRNWPEYRRHIIMEYLALYERQMQISHGSDINTTLVSGHASKGVDRMAEEIAVDLGWDLELHPAQWDKYGRGAGFIRNSHMVALGADICYAFIYNNSPGATHCAEVAQKAGIETVIHR